MMRFLRLWIVLVFSYALVKFVFNLYVMGWIDLRWEAFLELVFVPLGQSIVFWFVSRLARRRETAPGSVSSLERA
jgi:hypothetical protein